MRLSFTFLPAAIKFLLVAVCFFACTPSVFASPSHTWLLSQQLSNGSFGNANDIALASQATSETITALMMESVVAPASLQTASDFLFTGDITHTETLSRQLLAASTLSGAISNATLQTLISYQNADGGFGSYQGYESDPISTSWALRVFAAAHLNNQVVANAIGYLLNSVNTNSGWHVDRVSNVAVTAEVVIALNAYKTYTGVPRVIASARAFLVGQKQNTGLWNSDFESALALSALAVGSSSQSDLQQGLQALDAKKLADFSWQDDVYTTALVLQAFKRINTLATSGNALGSIQGQVLLRGSSLPIANGSIYINGNLSPVKTDNNGNFTLPGVAEGLVTIVVQKDGYQAVSVAVQVDASVNNDAGKIFLSPISSNAVVGGHIFENGTGVAIANAQVTLSGITSINLSTNSLGDIDTTSVTPGAYTYQISANGYYPISGSFNLAQGGRILLSQGLISNSTPLTSDPVSLSAVIVDGSTSLVVPFAAISIDGNFTTADSNGQFTSVPLPRGAHTIVITANGYVTSEYNINVPPGATGSLGQLALYSTQSSAALQEIQLLAKCVDSISGVAVPGASVKVTSTLNIGLTNTQGIVTLSHIQSLQFSVDIQAAGYLQQRYTVEASGFGSIAGTFALTPQPANNSVFSLKGVVKDADTSAPIAGVAISIPGVLDTVSDQNGNYLIEGAQHIPFVLRALKDGYVPFQKDIYVSEDAGAYVFDIPLSIDHTVNLFTVEHVDAPSVVEPDSTPMISATLKNLSTNTQEALVLVHVMDISGAEIATLAPQIPNTTTTSPHVSFAASQEQTLVIPWPVQQAAAGAYSVVVDVVEPGTATRDLPQGHIMATGSINVAVSGVIKFGGALDLSPPLLQAGAQTPITMTVVLRNTGNQLLGSGDYKLSVYSTDENQPVFSSVKSVAEMPQNKVEIVDFGNWQPGQGVLGQLHVKVVRVDGTQGQITGDLYIGDMAKAQFTINKSVLPEGNSAITGNIHLTGVDTSTATASDPLLAVVKAAVEKGANYIGPQAKIWQQTNNCLGCHIQAQTLAALGSAIGKANIDKNIANYLLNEISTGLRPEGAINTHETYYGQRSSTLLADWALTEWQQPEETINTLMSGLGYIWSIRQQGSGTMHWGGDIAVGWLTNDYSSTALATLAAVRAKENVGKLNSLPVNYVWGNNAFGLNGNQTGDHALKASGGFIYAAKPNGWVEKFTVATGTSQVLFTSLPGVSGRINGFEIDGNGNFLLSTEQGKLLRVNQAGQILNTYSVCSTPTGGVAMGPSGEVYIACPAANEIRRLGTDEQVTLVLSGGLLSYPYGLAWHPDGFLVIANYSKNQILKMTPSGNASIYGDGLSDWPVHIAVLPTGEVFVTGNKTRGESFGIELIRANGTIRRVVVDSQPAWNWPSAPWDIVVANNGLLYVSNELGNQLKTIQTTPANTQIIDTYMAVMPDVINYFLSTFDINDIDNLNQASRLIGLAEARKQITNTTLKGQADTAINQLANLLRSRQSSIGGWSLQGVADDSQADVNKKSDPLITAFVGLALEYTSPSAQDPMVRKAITYLLNQQQPNGIWRTNTGLFTTDLGTTSLVMVYMPKAIERLGGLDLKVDLNIPSTIALSAPNLVPTQQEPAANGDTHYQWNIQGVTSSGRDVSFNLAINNLALGEIRSVADVATLSFGNSFTGETIVNTIDVPTVNALSQLSLNVSTNKSSYGANEAVQISAVAKNMGPAFAGGSVNVSIRAAGYTGVLDTMAPLAVTSLATQQSTTVPANWNTGILLAGNYEVFGQLLDSKGRVVAQGTAPFTISAASTGNSILGAQVFSDKPSYLDSDIANINSRAINMSLNVDYVATLGRLTVKNTATNAVVLSHSYAIPALVIGANSANLDALPLKGVAAGHYIATWEIYNASGSTLIAQSTAQFDVIANPRGSINGSVSAMSTSIPAGAAQQCNFTINNTAASPLALSVSEVVINLDTQQTEESFSLAPTIVANGSSTNSQILNTATYTKGNHACVLQAIVAGQTVNLAQAMFTVTEPVITLSSAFTQQAKGRLLVLLDPVTTSPDAALQDTYIRQLLDGAGWLYTIVNSSDSFESETNNGGYSLYALLGQNTKLSDSAAKVLRVRVLRGDGMLVNSNTDWPLLDDLLGIIPRSNKAYNAGISLQQSLLGSAWDHNFNHYIPTLGFSTSGATVVGNYQNQLPGADANKPLGSLGFAGGFNLFAFEDFASLSSNIEGRLAVGGNLNADAFNVGEKQAPNPLSDVVYVKGNATFSTGHIYNGNLIANGTVTGISSSVITSMASGAKVLGKQTLPFVFNDERSYLQEMSLNLSTLAATGTVTLQGNTLSLKGDGTSKLQVFNVNATVLPSTNTFDVSGIPTGATIVFNVIGSSVTVKTMVMTSLAAIRQNVLFNVYQAKTLALNSVGLEGSVLAPLASITAPTGNINGQVVVRTWSVSKANHMSVANYPFTGDLSVALGPISKNAVSTYRYPNGGKTAFAGFDVLGQATALRTQTDNPFASLLLSELNYINPDVLANTTQRVLPYKVDIKNLSAVSVNAKAVLSIGNNATVIRLDGFSPTATTGQWLYPFTLNANQSLSQMLYLQLPDVAGTVPIRLQVQVNDGATTKTLLDNSYSVTAQ